eukprot:m.1810 g.1810  ORF g.1810 m.1810 type:complete len:69 (+) comp1279_c0_seq1:168-374(+)
MHPWPHATVQACKPTREYSKLIMLWAPAADASNGHGACTTRILICTQDALAVESPEAAAANTSKPDKP